MFGAARIVDIITAAQSIQRIGTTRIAPPRQRQRIENAVKTQNLPVMFFQLGIQEFNIKFGIVNHQPVIADKGQKFIGNLGKYRLIFQKFCREPMHALGFFRHIPFRIEIDMIGLAGGNGIEQLDAANFHNAVALRRVKPGGFRIQYNFTHRRSILTNDSADDEPDVPPHPAPCRFR